GLVVDGSGSTAVLDGTDVTGKTRGIHASNDGSVSLIGGIVKTGINSSNNSSTVHVESGASLTSNNTQFVAETEGLGTGDLTNVVWANGAGTTVDLTEGSVRNENTQFGRGLLASSSASISTNEVQISTAGELSNAVHAYSGFKTTGESTDKPSIELSGGTVKA